MRLSSSLSRSSMAEESPSSRAASMSSALASLRRRHFVRAPRPWRADRRSSRAVVSLASSRDAALACLANCVICSVKVMREEGKPKSQSEKREVSGPIFSGHPQENNRQPVPRLCRTGRPSAVTGSWRREPAAPARGPQHRVGKLLRRPFIAVQLPKDATLCVQHDGPQIMGDAGVLHGG